jgi:hypothetical protein
MLRRLLWLSLLAAGTTAVVTHNSSKVAAHERRLNAHAAQLGDLQAGIFRSIPSFGGAYINAHSPGQLFMWQQGSGG